MKKQTNVTIFNEYIHERNEERIRSVYPDGIHGAIAEKLSACGDYHIRFATLDMPKNGLTQEVLDDTDVLIWWAHVSHDAIPDEIAQRVRDRV